MPTSRGIRNNNPGNIDWNRNNNWVGQLGIEQGVSNPRFARFDTMENGVRALGRNLLTYFGRGLDTVAEIIGRWAPTNENNTSAYASAVARELGVGVNQRLNLRDENILTKLATAIIRHENGGLGGVTGAQISAGIRRALGIGGSAPAPAPATGPSEATFLCPHCSATLNVS